MKNQEPYTNATLIQTFPIHSDNTLSLSNTKIEQISSQSKHIDTKYNHIKDMIDITIVKPHYIKMDTTTCEHV